MDATIREASPGEEERILPLYEWLFDPPGSLPRLWDPDRARWALTQALLEPQSAVFIAEEDGEPAGFCTAYLDHTAVRFGQRCWVEDLAVHPDRRSSGIGKGLLDAAKDWARGAGATLLELHSGVHRTDAHRFYEREQPTWKSLSFSWELEPADPASAARGRPEPPRAD
jgi:GNAT superfamily N-acetyltransferase